VAEDDSDGRSLAGRQVLTGQQCSTEAFRHFGELSEVGRHLGQVGGARSAFMAPTAS
jgi:hypothetical protein